MKIQFLAKYIPNFKWTIVNLHGDQMVSPRICTTMGEYLNIKESFISSFGSDVLIDTPDEDLRLFMTDIGF